MGGEGEGGRERMGREGRGVGNGFTKGIFIEGLAGLLSSSLVPVRVRSQCHAFQVQLIEH